MHPAARSNSTLLPPWTQEVHTELKRGHWRAQKDEKEKVRGRGRVVSLNLKTHEESGQRYKVQILKKQNKKIVMASGARREMNLSEEMKRSIVESEGGTWIAPARSNPKTGALNSDITPGRLGDSQNQNISVYPSGNNLHNIRLSQDGLVERVTVKTLQKSFTFQPSGTQLKMYLRYLDLGVMSQRAFNGLKRLLYFISILELILIVLALIVFARYQNQMWPMLFHSLHFFRAIIGLTIYANIPSTATIIESLRFTDERTDMNTFINMIKHQIRRILLRVISNIESALLWYFIFTILCLICDIGDFALQVYYSSDNQRAVFPLICLLFFSIVMLIVDIYYLIWITTVHSEYPQDMQDQISAFLKGAANNLRRYLLLHLTATYGSNQGESNMEIVAGGQSNYSEKAGSPRGYS